MKSRIASQTIARIILYPVAILVLNRLNIAPAFLLIPISIATGAIIELIILHFVGDDEYVA